jgi:tight adherence protein C
MRFALSLAASAGIYLVASTSLFGSKNSLLNRLREVEVHTLRLSGRLSTIKESLRLRLVSRKKLRMAVSELPEIIELMAVSLSAGDGIYGALTRVVPRASGVLAESLRTMLASLELGGELDVELERLAQRLPHRQIVEFTGKVSIALRRGTPLSQMLSSLAESARADQRNELLKQVGRNETKMLIPLVFLILPVTVLFAVYPSLQLLNIDYI